MAEKGYKLSATIASKYAPLINRSRMLHEQTQKSEFPALREGGATNVDLWTDGSIYPVHPVSRSRPRFRSVSELLEYVGEGKRGLFGYIESLCSSNNSLQFRFNEAQRESEMLREQLRKSIDEIEERNRLLQFAQSELIAREAIVEQSRAALLSNELLKNELRGLQEEFNSVRTSGDERIQNLEAASRDSTEERFEMELQMWIEIESMKETHAEKLRSISVELERTRATLRRQDLRIQKMVKTPFGYRSIIRTRKDLSDLTPGGGQAKRTMRLARSIIAPATTNLVHSENMERGSRLRLCGGKETQSETGKALAAMLTKNEVTAMCHSSKLKEVGVSMANYYMNEIGENIGAHEILETCDRNGITHQGYGAIYKQFKGAAKIASKGLRIGCLPNPHRIFVMRKMLNLKLHEYVGDYYSITNNLEVAPAGKSKGKEPVKIILNENNSLFTDVEQVQRTMVEIYSITPEELNGQPLIFVLKLDEAEIIHAQKLERVSLTLMNRALNTNIDPKSKEYFSVQSEREIWPIASFQVPRETHEILHWVFSQTKIPSLIEAQESGQKLDVPGIGLFSVEWHLAADMKTVKCMYGLKMGANSRHSCIYCNQERVKPVVATIAHAIAANKSRKFTWDEGLFSDKVSGKPVNDKESLARWKPILAIPLDRVHICTLHAFNRVIEKLVHLHFMQVWVIRDPSLQKLAVEKMQKAVSLTGAHGGNVVIFKDSDLSGKSNSVPNKPSFSGAHALKLFAPNPGELENPHKLYVDVVNAEQNSGRKGQDRRDRIELWNLLDELRLYFKGLRLEEGQSAAEFKQKMEEWGHLYIKCFGEHSVTHYMHVLVRHAPYFLERYGSLSVWSCQGMENSHHTAKTAYQRHTQHSGGKMKKSPLVQTFQHWYRIIAHRFRNKETAVNISEFDTLEAEATISTRREASLQSSAAVHSVIWRAKCTCVGSRWVPNQNQTEEPSTISVDTL